MVTSKTTVDHQWEIRLTASPARVRTNEKVTLAVALSHPSLIEPSDEILTNLNKHFKYTYSANDPRLSRYLPKRHNNGTSSFKMPSLPDGDYEISVNLTVLPESHDSLNNAMTEFMGGVRAFPLQLHDTTTLSVVTHQIEAQANVTLQRSASAPTNDQALFAAIRNRTSAISFARYQRFIDRVLCENADDLILRMPIPTVGNRNYVEAPLSIFGPYAYSILKLATQAFLTLECGVLIRDDDHLFNEEDERIRFGDPHIDIDELQTRLAQYLMSPEQQAPALPYLKRIANAFVSLDIEDGKVEETWPYCQGILKHRLTAPSMMELIWSYWVEEGMLVQTMNAIAWRFQNRLSSPNDPLGELEFDSLRPLNNLLWGFIQDEHNRLTVPRRAYEYQHHYGISLIGKAVPAITPADIRSKFIEAFHNLLYRTDRFYREDRDTTMIADAFPLLNALKEVHLLLAEGAHNQFGDLTWTARVEMLTMQWMLARPEMREFLRGRYAVPYQEPWMGAVDSMKKLQGWTDCSITHFHELAVTGERILLSIRYGDWVDVNNSEDHAKNWARNSKPEIQRYLSAYQTATGVDLTAEITDTRDGAIRFLQPSALLQRRLSSKGATPALGAMRPLRAIPAATPTYAEQPVPQASPVPKLLADK